MSKKIYLEEVLYDLKAILQQNRFLVSNSDNLIDDKFSVGVLTGIESCINEIERRLKETI